RPDRARRCWILHLDHREVARPPRGAIDWALVRADRTEREQEAADVRFGCARSEVTDPIRRMAFEVVMCMLVMVFPGHRRRRSSWPGLPASTLARRGGWGGR